MKLIIENSNDNTHSTFSSKNLKENVETFNNTFSQGFSNDLKKHLEKLNTTFSIDRFEENYAVCENQKTGEFIDIPIEELPSGCKEGSILKFENNKYVLDLKKTKTAQKEIEDLANNLFKKRK